LIKFKDDPALPELTQEVSLLIEYLPELVGMDRPFFVDMEKPLAGQVCPMVERVCDSTLGFSPKAIQVFWDVKSQHTPGFPRRPSLDSNLSRASKSTIASTRDGEADSPRFDSIRSLEYEELSPVEPLGSKSPFSP
jgi:hypothetical protein